MAQISPAMGSCIDILKAEETISLDTVVRQLFHLPLAS